MGEVRTTTPRDGASGGPLAPRAFDAPLPAVQDAGDADALLDAIERSDIGERFVPEFAVVEEVVAATEEDDRQGAPSLTVPVRRRSRRGKA